MNDIGLLKEHNQTFIYWFNRQIRNDNIIKWLEYGVKYIYICWDAWYDINKLSFYTKSHDDKSIIQNSEFMVMTSTMQISS